MCVPRYGVRIGGLSGTSLLVFKTFPRYGIATHSRPTLREAAMLQYSSFADVDRHWHLIWFYRWTYGPTKPSQSMRLETVIFLHGAGMVSSCGGCGVVGQAFGLIAHLWDPLLPLDVCTPSSQLAPLPTDVCTPSRGRSLRSAPAGRSLPQLAPLQQLPHGP